MPSEICCCGAATTPRRWRRSNNISYNTKTRRRYNPFVSLCLRLGRNMRWRMNPDLLLTKSLRDAPWGAAVARIMAAALDAVEPAAAVRRFLRRDGGLLRAGDRTYDLGRYERVFVVGTGKAGAPMARAAAEALGDRLTSGVVVVKQGHT